MKEQGLFGPMEPLRLAGSLVTAAGARIVTVALDAGVDNIYDYVLPDGLADSVQPGQRVRVPFGRGNRLKKAFCVDFPKASQQKKLKVVHDIVDPTPLLDEQMLQVAKWIAKYYYCPLGTALSAMVPAAVKQQAGTVKKTYLRLADKGRSFSPDDISALRLSRQGRAIIEYLQSTDQSADKLVPLNDLAQLLGCTKAPFHTLARADFIELSRQPELPLPDTEISQGLLDDAQSAGRPVLNAEQQKAFEKIESLIDQKNFNVCLLHGVTGSGKTEVYMRCIEKVIAKGMQALVLVPEIALTPQTQSRFLARFKRVAVLHSGLSDTQRNRQWQSIANGNADVVVGARSAVFAPLSKPGIIVVDEEHEPSYKQDNTPRYHGRDVAIIRAHLQNITIVLGSATPSMETLHNCQSKQHYHLLRLPNRVLNLPLPKVTIVNMSDEILQRKGNHLISGVLEDELRKCIREKHQAILLLNRRGHSNFIFCPSCRFVLTCPNCDVTLTHHKRKKEFPSSANSMMMCHHCLHRCKTPSLCPLCGGKLILIGPGTQRAEEEIKRKFPDLRLQRVDSDSMRSQSYPEILEKFGKGQIDVLMGTQMIGKGLDFPNVTLVGVLNADTALSIPDFRSSERTFQLITQVAGRAGRAFDNGKVIVQSFIPDDPTIKMACKHDYDGFSKHELTIRQRCSMPPYRRLARFIIRDRQLKKATQAGKELRQSIDQLNRQLRLEIKVRGPMPAAVARLENYHRQEILLRANTPEQIQQLLNNLRKTQLPEIKLQTTVDVDPLNLM